MPSPSVLDATFGERANIELPRILRCSAAGTYENFEEFLGQSGLLAVEVEPFVGDLQLTFGLGTLARNPGVAHRSPMRGQSYNGVHYVSAMDEIPGDTFLLIARDQAHYTCLLCLSHSDMTVRMTPGDAQTLNLNLQSGSSRKANRSRCALLCARGPKLSAVFQGIFQHALKLTGDLGKPRTQKGKLPIWINSWGWQSPTLPTGQPSHQGIIEAVTEMARHGCTPGYVLLGEGWQDLAAISPRRSEHKALVSFGANPELFPKGLRGFIDELHGIGVIQVGVWHGIMGSRGGIHPSLAAAYDLPTDEQGRYFLGHDLGGTFQFFHDYYGHLRQEGVTFNEVGDQHSIATFCRKGMDLTRLHSNLQTAMQGAASTQFNSAQLNRECLGAENIFYWPTSQIACCDEEEFDDKNPVGIQRTVRNRLQNSLWLQHLMLPCTAPWRQPCPYDETLAIYQALSGSTMTLSGRPDFEQQRHMAKLMLPDGRLIRPNRALTVCERCAVENPLISKKPYLAFTTKSDWGIVAAFNLGAGHKTLHGTVSLEDLENWPDAPCAVLSHHHGFVGVIKGNEHLNITLKPEQADVFTFAPIHDGVAVLGCYSYYLAPGPVSEVSLTEDDIHIHLLVAAPLVVYCERKILDVHCDNHAVPWEYQEHRHVLSIEARQHVVNKPCCYSITFE